jgi:hypothetical protein
MRATADTDELMEIYRIKARIQEDLGRPDVAAQIEDVLHALDAYDGERVPLGSVSDANRHYMLFLGADARSVLGVVVPPRTPGNPAPSLEEQGLA